MEATVALAVFTIGMLGLGGSFSQIIRAGAVARQKQIAVLLAERKLAEFRVAEAVGLAPTHGTFGTDFDGYTWEARFGRQSKDLQLLDVWIDVQYQSGATARLWSQIVVTDES